MTSTLDPAETAADAAFGEWRRRVEANREQIERLREDERRADFYQASARRFRPNVESPAELPQLLELGGPDDVWLDIGAGGGRYAVPLARHIRQLIAVEPSPAMRETLSRTSAEAGLSNVDVLDFRWPPEDGDDVPRADVTLVAHVLYDQDDLRAFLEAMETHTQRLCAVILGDRAPRGAHEPVWSELHGEPVATLPAASDFIAVLELLGRHPEVRRFPLPARPAIELDEALATSRRLYWLQEGSPKDGLLRELLQRTYGTSEGLVALPDQLHETALITWSPPGARAAHGSTA